MKLALEDKRPRDFSALIPGNRKTDFGLLDLLRPWPSCTFVPGRQQVEAAETLHPRLVSQEGDFLHPLHHRQASSGEACSLRRKGCFWAELGLCRV